MLVSSFSLSLFRPERVIIYTKARCRCRHSLFYIALKNLEERYLEEITPIVILSILKLNSEIKLVSHGDVVLRLRLEKHRLHLDLSRK